jgi:hypothetical protein
LGNARFRQRQRGSRAKAAKPGKAGLSVPRDSDWIRAAKDQGAGFSGNATAVYRYSDNPARVEYRNPPEHRYDTLPYGGDSGVERTATQNRLANQRKK